VLNQACNFPSCENMALAAFDNHLLCHDHLALCVQDKKKNLYEMKRKYQRDEDLHLELAILMELDAFLSKVELREAAHVTEEEVIRCRAQIRALEARLKKERGDSPASVAQAYLEAARMCALPNRNRGFPLHKDVWQQHHVFLCHHHRYAAIALLALHSSDWPTIIGHLSDAVDCAKKAEELCRSNDVRFNERNVRYQTYWLLISKLRYELIKPRKDFAKTIALLHDAINCAGSFGESIFPNRFYTLDDLRNEIHFIRGYKAFCENEFADCFVELGQWLGKSPNLEGTWRYGNIKIRCLVAEILASIDSNRHVCRPKEEVFSEIFRITRQQGVGLACLEIIHQAEILDTLATSGILPAPHRASILRQIVDLFPLDSQAEEIKSASLYDKFKYDGFEVLPRYFYDSYQTAEVLADRNDIEGCRKHLSGVLRYLLLFTNEYLYAKAMALRNTDWFEGLPVGFDKAFEKMDLEQLVRALDNLFRALQKTIDVPLDKIEQLGVFVRQLLTTQDLKRELSYARREFVNNFFARLFPHVVFCEEINENQTEFKVRRIWKKAVPEFLHLHGQVKKLQVARFYYLHPNWKGSLNRRFSFDRVQFEAYPARLVEKTIMMSSYFVPGLLVWDGNVSELLSADEGPLLEFKPSDKLFEGRDIIDWMIAFGNNYPQGGKLVIGVSDAKDPSTNQRQVYGFTADEKFINRLYGKARQQVEPSLLFQAFRAEWREKEFLIIQVLPFRSDAADPYVVKDKAETFFREGASTIRYSGFTSIRQRFLDQMRVVGTAA
jgi:hypothetical protein